MAVKLSAGDFKEKVVFLKPTEVVNDEGGIELSHQPEINTRAFVKRINQFRAQEAGAAALIDAKEFYIRRSAEREAIDKDWLMEYRGVNWTLHSIDLYEEKFFQIIAKVKS